MATEAGSDSRCGIGARLRAARERATLSILQVSEKLHADPRVIEALEAERFEELGAAVFVRGHIRRYAELVRESPDELQDLYSHSTHAVARPDLTRIPTTGTRTQDPNTLLIPGVLLVITVGLIGLVWWFLTSLRTPTPPVTASPVGSGEVVEEASEETPPEAYPRPAPEDLAPAPNGMQGRSGSSTAQTATPRNAPGAAGGNTAASGSPGALASAGSPASANAPTRPDEAPPGAGDAGSPSAPMNPPSVGTASTAAPGASSAEPGPPPAAEAPAASDNGAGATKVTLHFSGDSWAEIYDARGNRLFYDIGSADSVKTLSGAAPLRVILGNPSGVSLEVNGKPASVPRVEGAENGIQFSVNRSGRVSRARPAPTGAGG